MTTSTKRASDYSAGLCNASILLYIVWLLLPMAQAAGRAVTGAACCGLFVAGVLLDWAYLKEHWLSLCLRALCVLLAPVALWFFCGRGGTNFAGFYVQQTMFWFPLVYCAYARERGDRRLWRYVKWTLLGAVTLTTLTTIGWLVQGMLRGGRVYAYSRSLGYAEAGREAYLRELMLRNIGGYDFVYATVVSLPFTTLATQRKRGWARAGYAALLSAQAVMIVLSQYTYAMVFAACALCVELFALIVRRASRGRVGMGASLLWGAVPLLAVVLLREPLVSLAASLCERAGFASFAFSLRQLLTSMQGGATETASRLDYYLQALDGFKRSPFVGSMFGGEKLLSQHSDLLDLLSGMGLAGAAAFGGMVWLMGRGSLRGLARSASKAQLCMAALLLAAVALLGTVVYSRDIMAVAALGVGLVLEEESAMLDAGKNHAGLEWV